MARWGSSVRKKKPPYGVVFFISRGSVFFPWLVFAQRSGVRPTTYLTLMAASIPASIAMARHPIRVVYNTICFIRFKYNPVKWIRKYTIT